MMEVNPLTDVIRQVLTGSGECATVDWTFLGLSMPAWSLLWFVLLALLVLAAAFERRGIAPDGCAPSPAVGCWCYAAPQQHLPKMSHPEAPAPRPPSLPADTTPPTSPPPP